MEKKHKLTTYLLTLTLALFSLGQLGRISFQQQLINGYLYEIPLALYIITVLYTKRHIFTKTIKEKYMSVIVFLVYLLVNFLVTSLGLSFSQNIVAFLYLLRLIGYFLFSILLTAELGTSTILAKRVIKLLFAISIVTALTSVIQYFVYQDLSLLYYEGWDPHLYRMFGVFFDPVFAGAAYGMIAIFIWFYRGMFTKRWLWILFLILMAACILLTYSRGAYIAALISLSLFLWRTKRYKIILIVFAIFCISIILLPKKFGEGVNLLRSSTIESRYLDDKEALDIWKKYPLSGIGYNRIRDVKKSANDISPNGLTYSHAGASFHSSYLTLLVTGGVIGLLLFIWVLIDYARKNTMTFYMTLYLSIMSLFDNILFYPLTLMLFFLFLALPKVVNSPSDT